MFFGVIGTGHRHENFIFVNKVILTKSTEKNRRSLIIDTANCTFIIYMIIVHVSFHK